MISTSTPDTNDSAELPLSYTLAVAHAKEEPGIISTLLRGYRYMSLAADMYILPPVIRIYDPLPSFIMMLPSGVCAIILDSYVSAYWSLYCSTRVVVSYLCAFMYCIGISSYY